MSDTKPSNQEIEREQERKLKEKLGGETKNLTDGKKKHPAFLKERKQYFDSADYNMKGKVDDPTKKTIPKVMKKGDSIASARHLTPAHTDEESHLKEGSTDDVIVQQEDEVEEEEN